MAKAADKTIRRNILKAQRKEGDNATDACLNVDLATLVQAEQESACLLAKQNGWSHGGSASSVLREMNKALKQVTIYDEKIF